VGSLAAGLAFGLGGDDVVTQAEAAAGTPQRVRNIYVDPETGQLILTPTGNLAMVADLEAIAQAIDQAVNTYLGEWFLDETIGLPWFQSILVKNPDIASIKALITAAIVGVQGVQGLTSLDATFDRGARTLQYTFTATTDLGLLANRTFTVGGVT